MGRHTGAIMSQTIPCGPLRRDVAACQSRLAAAANRLEAVAPGWDPRPAMRNKAAQRYFAVVERDGRVERWAMEYVIMRAER